MGQLVKKQHSQTTGGPTPPAGAWGRSLPRAPGALARPGAAAVRREEEPPPGRAGPRWCLQTHPGTRAGPRVKGRVPHRLPSLLAIARLTSPRAAGRRGSRGREGRGGARRGLDDVERGGGGGDDGVAGSGKCLGVAERRRDADVAKQALLGPPADGRLTLCLPSRPPYGANGSSRVPVGRESSVVPLSGSPEPGTTSGPREPSHNASLWVKLLLLEGSCPSPLLALQQQAEAAPLPGSVTAPGALVTSKFWNNRPSKPTHWPYSRGFPVSQHTTSLTAGTGCVPEAIFLLS
ncbi:fibril-forming collagen alpha chain-like [Chroicocephalus ridibundus]|uniref:fibril-forming collagen alpha chain-like n=1 Tax=Chroicocephalus ridibundus TaxID=1192867 RepID=UPI002FDEB0B7